MHQRWFCSCGHQWDAPAAPASAVAPPCPRCGEAGRRAELDVPLPMDCLAATLDHPGPPLASSSPVPDKTVTRPGSAEAGAHTGGPGGGSAPGSEDAETLARPVGKVPTGGGEGASLPKTVEIPCPGSEAEIEMPHEGDDQPTPGATVIGGHEILGELGRGGMGVVFKAKHLKLRRTVALKMIRSGVHGNQHELKRFQAEARAVALLHHPNIIQIFEIGEWEGQPYISLEYAEGGSLASRLDGKPVRPKQAANMVQTIAGAVHYAHQQGIVHRDLKPANVLQAKDGTLKLTDFGLAKSLKEDSQQTGAGNILGTPSYMAPEQAEGRNQDIGPASDIYALGAILYELLTGRPPFVGESVLDTLQMVQAAEPVPPRRLQPTIPADLETICLKCLQKEPARRYATAADLEEDLRRFVAGEPIRARPVTAVERLIKWCRRRPAIAALVALLILTVTGGFFGMMGLWLHAETERIRADNARTEAVVAKIRAEEEEKKAREQKAEADKARAKAQEEEKTATARLYITQIGLAQTALKEGHPERALGILNEMKSRFTSKTKEDLRGFEWYYLTRLCQSPYLRLRGHTSVVTQVIFSPDGKKLATASLDQTIKLWDHATGQELATLRGHQRPLRYITFSSDGKLLASASAAGDIRIWDVERGRDVHALPLTGHKYAVTGLAFSPDAKLLASASIDQTIKVWSVSSGHQLKTLTGHTAPVTAVAFRPDGKQLASASEDLTIKLWQWPQGIEEQTLKGHSHWVACVAYSVDGKLLGSGGWDQTIRLWDLVGNKPPQVLSGHKSPLRHLAFGPDGYKLASLCHNGGVRVWDLRTGTEMHQFPPVSELVRTVVFSEDGQLLASLSFDRRVVDQTPVYAGHGSGVYGVCLWPDGQRAVSVGGSATVKTGMVEGEIQIWDVEKRETLRTLRPHQRLVRCVACSGDGKLLASGGEDRLVLLLDTETGKVLERWEGHEKRVRAVAFLPGGQEVVSASDDGRILFWKRGRSSPVRLLTGHQGGVHGLAINAEGTLLASAGIDHTVRLWARKGDRWEETMTLAGHTDAVNCVAFHPREQILVSGSSDQTIRLWDLATGKELHLLSGHGEAVQSVAFSPEGKRLASGAADHTVKVWDPQTGQELLSLNAHRHGVTSVVFSARGGRLLSASWDNTVRVWEAGSE